MSVYIEYVIIDNIVFTYLICALSLRLARVGGRFWRNGCAAALGTAVAVWYPFLSNTCLTLAIKAALCAAMTLIVFPPKRFLRGVLSILAATFLFGGAVFFIGYIRYGNVQMALVLPPADFPIGLVLIPPLFIYALLRRLVLRRHKLSDCMDMTARMRVDYNGYSVDCKAFMDSGNRVYDGVSGLPVIVMSMRAGLKLLSDEQLTQVMLGKAIPGARFQEVSGLSKKNRILLVRPKKIALYVGDKENIIDNVMLGLSFSKFNDVEEYDAILNPAILSEVKKC